MGLKVKGIKKVNLKMQVELAELREDVIQATFLEGHAIMREALRLVPWDTGALASSNDVELAQRMASVAVVHLRFEEDYAAAVHNLNKNYNNGRSWMYLRRPLLQAMPGFAGRVASRAKKLR